MRAIILKTLVLIFMTTLCLAEEVREQGSEQLFLAHNIWKTPLARHMRCINYKIGKIMPFGTEVINAKVFRTIESSGNAREPILSEGDPKIRFTLKETNESVEISFVNKWHPGKTIYDYYDQMFTNKSFSELSYGMDEKKLEKISRGEILVGMTKQEVILAYGYPPEHKTRSLDNNSWRYWIDTLKTKEICFDGENKTIVCGSLGL